MARPVDRPICGLAAGRRHRNQAFREELTRRLEERGGPSNGGRSLIEQFVVDHFIFFQTQNQLMFPALYLSGSSQAFPSPLVFHPADTPVLLDQLSESLPALPLCELVDPADDQTLPRLIEVLEQRLRVRQMMTEQFNKTGTDLFFSAP